MRPGAIIEATLDLAVIALIVWGMAGCGANLFRPEPTTVYTPPRCVHVNAEGDTWWSKKCHGTET